MPHGMQNVACVCLRVCARTLCLLFTLISYRHFSWHKTIFYAEARKTNIFRLLYIYVCIFGLLKWRKKTKKIA